MENRLDYFGEWVGDYIYHQFERSRLKAIHIQYDGRGVGVFSDIRRYEFSYAPNNATDNTIFPTYTYSAGGKVTTLREVREYGASNGSLPAHTFTYGDNIHLTNATNGYGGSVQFSYDTWYSEINARASYLHEVYFGAADGWAPCRYVDPTTIPWVARSGSAVLCGNEGNSRWMSVAGIA